jgi:hypothetical protein
VRSRRRRRRRPRHRRSNGSAGAGAPRPSVWPWLSAPIARASISTTVPVGCGRWSSAHVAVLRSSATLSHRKPAARLNFGCSSHLFG